ncbi:MAG: hypothetical protein ACRDHD_06315, partial [Candidatus Limnocylindria bacterium]
MRHLRRILIMAAAAALLVGSLPAVASAHRADRFSDSRLGIMCDMLTGEQGTAILFLEVSAQFGGSALVGYWEPGTSPEMDPPTLISNESEVIGTVEGSTVDAVMQLYTFLEPDPEDPEPDFYGEPAGEATMSATLTPNGEIQTETQRSQDSNARFEVEITSQELAVAGDLALPGEVAFDLSACRGVRESFEGFATNPDTYIQRSESLSLSCSWTDEDRSVFLFAGAGSFGGFSELYVIDASGEYGGFSEASLTTDAFSAEYELFAFGGGDEEPVLAAVPGEPGDSGEAAGAGSAVATLSPNGESGHFIDRLGSEMFKA